MRDFLFIWLLYPHKHSTKVIKAYDLKQARKLMLKHVKAQFYTHLGQDPNKNRKGYFAYVN